MSVADVPLGPITPRCAAHPKADATGTCSRCGTFYCQGCAREVFGKSYCAPCSRRPEINYLDEFRLKLWGRRDGGAWIIGIGSLGLGLLGFEHLRFGRYEIGLSLAACALAGVLFFAGLRWAREALVVTPLLCAIGCAVRNELATAGYMLIFTLVASGLYLSPRNQLFFRRPLSPKQLQKLWHQREDNPRARDALNLGVGSLFVPLFAPAAIILGVIGLQRVNPDSTPPIGRKAHAMGGIVLGGLAIMGWAALFWSKT